MKASKFPVCDFCTARTADLVEFAANEHRVTISVTSLSGRPIRAAVPTPHCWRACPACRELFDAGDEAGLLERSVLTALAHAAC